MLIFALWIVAIIAVPVVIFTALANAFGSGSVRAERRKMEREWRAKDGGYTERLRQYEEEHIYWTGHAPARTQRIEPAFS